MGGHPYWYAVPYRDDVGAALQDLRRREFQAGRYNPVVPFPEFPIAEDSLAPGPAHASIDAACAAAGEEGTRSILDLMRISPQPEPCTASPVPLDVLEDVCGTEHPDRATLDDCLFDLLDDLGRGEGLYVVVYDHDQPSEIVFAGYSFD